MHPSIASRVRDIQAHQDPLNAWTYVRLDPAPQLCGQIDSYCDYSETTAGFTTRRELPHAEGVLIINLGQPVEIVGGDGRQISLNGGEAFIAGVHLRPAWSRSNGAQCGIQVQLPLLTLRRLLGLPMQLLLDQVVRLDAVLGATTPSLLAPLSAATSLPERVRALDHLLLRRLGTSLLLDSRQIAGLQWLRTRPNWDISTIAAELGWSRKHYADRVHDAVGVGPRCFRRLLRFQHAHRALLSAGPHPAWADLAAASGYYDQSHLIREFREFASMTPAECHRRTLVEGGGLIEG